MHTAYSDQEQRTLATVENIYNQKFHVLKSWVNSWTHTVDLPSIGEVQNEILNSRTMADKLWGKISKRKIGVK